MTITLGAYTLCDGAVRDQDKWCGPAGLRIVSVRASQTAPRIRAARAALFPRANRVESVTFSCVRRCASVAAALTYIEGLPAAVPASGTLTIGATSYGTASCDLDVSLSGSLVRATFTLTAGAAS
jgi:hypothetical protein